MIKYLTPLSDIRYSDNGKFVFQRRKKSGTDCYSDISIFTHRNFLRNDLPFIKCLYLQPEVERKYEDVRGEKNDVCDAKTREEVVEQVLHGPKNSGNELCEELNNTYLSERMVRLMELPTRPRMERIEDIIPHIIHL